MAKMDPQQLLNKKIEMELKRAHENKKTSHAARLGSITLRGPSLSFSRNSRLPNSTNVTPRDNNATSIEEGTGQEEDG